MSRYIVHASGVLTLGKLREHWPPARSAWGLYDEEITIRNLSSCHQSSSLRHGTTPCFCMVARRGRQSTATKKSKWIWLDVILRVREGSVGFIFVSYFVFVIALIFIFALVRIANSFITDWRLLLALQNYTRWSMFLDFHLYKFTLSSLVDLSVLLDFLDRLLKHRMSLLTLIPPFWICPFNVVRSHCSYAPLAQAGRDYL